MLKTQRYEGIENMSLNIYTEQLSENNECLNKKKNVFYFDESIFSISFLNLINNDDSIN